MSNSWALAKWHGIVKAIRKQTLPVINPELLTDGVAKVVKKATKRYNRAKNNRLVRKELEDLE